MRASWMEDGRLSLLEVPPPERRGERLSRVTLAGISGTDLHMRRGYASYTGIPGHEFVGVVSGSIQTTPLVEGVFSLDRLEVAFDKAGRGLEVLLAPGEAHG